LREITEHEFALITGAVEPTEEDLLRHGFDGADWSRKARAIFTHAMEDDLEPQERISRARAWAEFQRDRGEARVEAYRACTRAIWAAIARGEIRNPFVETMTFRRPIGRG
jgi:hypothetical protein